VVVVGFGLVLFFGGAGFLVLVIAGGGWTTASVVSDVVVAGVVVTEVVGAELNVGILTSVFAVGVVHAVSRTAMSAAMIDAFPRSGTT
jgi:hypothetical protein